VADGNEGANYTVTFVPDTTGEITKASQTIDFANPGDQTTDDTVVLTANATSGLTVTFSSEEEFVKIEGSNMTFTEPFSAIAEVTVTASQSGNSNYDSAEDVSRTFVLRHRPVPTLSFEQRYMEPSRLSWLLQFDIPVETPEIDDLNIVLENGADGALDSIEEQVANSEYRITVNNWNDEGRIGLEMLTDRVMALSDDPSVLQNVASEINYMPTNTFNLLLPDNDGELITPAAEWDTPEKAADGDVANWAYWNSMDTNGVLEYNLNGGSGASIEMIGYRSSGEHPVKTLKVEVSEDGNNWATLLENWSLPDKLDNSNYTEVTSTYATKIRFTVVESYHGSTYKAGIAEIGAFGQLQEGPSVTLTVNVGDGGSSDPVGSVDVPLGNDRSVFIEADDWYRIDNITVSDPDYDGIDAHGDKSYELGLSNLQSDIIVESTFYQPETVSSYPNVPVDWLSSWGYSEDEMSGSEDVDLAYMLNTDPVDYSSNALEISKIEKPGYEPQRQRQFADVWCRCTE